MTASEMSDMRSKWYRKQIILPFLCGAFVLSLSACQTSTKNKEDAELHLTGGNYPNALKELSLAHDLDPNNEVIENNLGLAFFVREKYSLAEQHLQKALKLKPNYTDALNNLARVHIEMQQYNRAIHELETVLSDLTYSSAEKAWVNLGLAHFQKGEFQIAKNRLAEAIKINRSHCLAHTLYGRSELELEEFNKAAADLDKAVIFCKQSHFDEPHYFSGISYFRLGNKEKGMARMEEVIKFYPNGKYAPRAKNMIDEMNK
jgi:type IV pilus assembly protein PilF